MRANCTLDPKSHRLQFSSWLQFTRTKLRYYVSSVTASTASSEFEKYVFLALPCKCTSLQLTSVTWKLLTTLNYCFQCTHSQVIPQLVLLLFKQEKVLSTSAMLWGTAVINTLHNNCTKLYSTCTAVFANRNRLLEMSRAANGRVFGQAAEVERASR